MKSMKVLIVFLVFSKLKLAYQSCDFEKYPFISLNSSCTEQEFQPICTGSKAQCRYKSLTQLEAGYSNSTTGYIKWCTFPRILAGENGLVNCDNFKTDYLCPKNSSHLVSRATVCDGSSCGDCLSGYDDGYGTGFKCFKNKSYCGLPQVFLYDNVPDCDDHADICFHDQNYMLLKSCFNCSDGSAIIPRNALCDGVIDCPDLSDECLCPASNRLPICGDVISTYTSSEESEQCGFRDVKCGNGKCIKRDEICDGNIACLDGRDENAAVCGKTVECDGRNNTKDSDCRCPLTCSSNSTVNDNSTTCPLPDEIDIFCNETGKYVLQCNGQIDCNATASDEQHCPGQFVCQGMDNKWIILPIQKRCNYIVDCRDEEDETNCQDGRFRCRSGKPVLYISQRQVRNGRVDCKDGSDECLDDDNSTNSFFFHSQRTLIGNQILYVLVWIMAVTALIGNASVIVGQMNTILKNRRSINSYASLRANHILVLNLAAADLLMGVYLLGVGINYERLKGSYCQEELLWRGSSVCTWLGITALISCEASVLTLVMLTSVRLYTIAKPYKTAMKPPTWLILLLILLSWVFSCVIASLPVTDVFHSYIPDKALLPNIPFANQPIFSLGSGRQYLRESLVYYPPPGGDVSLPEILRQIESAKTWNTLAGIYNMLPEQKKQMNVIARFGFYNIHSICLADLFPRRDDVYVAFSLTLIIFNFIAFLYIAIVYVAVHMITFRNKSCDETEAIRLRRKIFLLVASNFLSWIPICILSFLRLQNYTSDVIDGKVYQAAAIVLLPINSSINPILYSNIIRNTCKKVFKGGKNVQKRLGSFGSVLTLSGTKSTADI